MTEPAWGLVEPHRERLVRVARRRVDSLEDAEDIAQEALIRVATFPALDHGRVGEMLTSVTMRLCVDFLRHRAVEREAVPRLVEVEPDPLAVMLDEFEARWLAEVPLTKAERTLLMARVHGLYPSEVAASLGLTVDSAKMALRRARGKITAAWKATLGVLGLSRLRRLLPAGAVVAVALAVVLAPLVRTEHAERTAAVREAPRVPRRAVVVPPPVPQVGPAPAQAYVTPAATPSVATPPPVTTVAVPPMKGPVWHGGVKVHLDNSEDPVTRVQRCLREGVAVSVGTASVTCRE